MLAVFSSSSVFWVSSGALENLNPFVYLEFLSSLVKLELTLFMQQVLCCGSSIGPRISSHAWCSLQRLKA